MKIIYGCLCFVAAVGVTLPAPAPSNIIFPDDRRDRKLEPIITPPVLPVIEHLERDPSTLLPNETNGRRNFGQLKPRFGGQVNPKFGGQVNPKFGGQINPKFGFGGGFNVAPSGSGGLTASFSGSSSGAGVSQSASQSFSFGFNDGFSASHSASQAASFNGFGSGLSGTQASSQAASFGSGGSSVSGAASSAAAFGGAGAGGSQSASSAFGFNSLNGFHPEATFGEGLLGIRHRGVPDFPIPSFVGRSKGIGTAAFRRSKPGNSRSKTDDDFFAILVSD